jgi:hypothetical protein
MTSRSNALKAIVATALILGVFAVCQANDKVKYCRDAQTGRIITVAAGMPCPRPTHEL